MIFDGIYDEKKYRYAAFNGRYQFGFNQIVDDRPYKANQSYDITLRVLTPNSDEVTDETTLRIMKKTAPYGDIFKLPGLLDQYISTYSKVLKAMQQPVLESIEDAKNRVSQELDGKECREQLSVKLFGKFTELREKAIHCNNVATIQNIKVEADALKIRCLNEISAAENKIMARKAEEEARRRAQEAAAQAAAGEKPDTPTPEPIPEPPKPKIKMQKTLSIKSINTSSTWQLESADDVRRYVSELQEKLMKTLEEDTVINIEF